MIRVSDAVLALDGVRVIDARLVDPSGEQVAAPSHVELVAAGSHAVTAQVALRGNAYGIFSMSIYRYLVRGSHTFDVPADRATELTVIAHLVGTVTTPLEERPRISFVARSADARPPTRGIGQPDQAQRREPEEVAR